MCYTCAFWPTGKAEVTLGNLMINMLTLIVYNQCITNPNWSKFDGHWCRGLQGSDILDVQFIFFWLASY